MSERYRTDYDGEFVIINNTIKDGKKHQEREWIRNFDKRPTRLATTCQQRQ